MIQYLKKQFLPGVLGLIFICLSISACGSPAKVLSSVAMLKEQHDFDTYTQTLFVQEMKENTLNLHYTLANPEEFGIKSHKISLGSFSEEKSDASASFLENMSASLSGFHYDSLNTKQKLTYDILKDYCEKQLSISSLYYYNEPLRPTTGVQSELPVLLAEYAFYNPCDVTDYLSLLTCIEDYFHQIAAFERKKAEKGLFMSPEAANTVIDACETFAIDPETNFLIDTFDTRIDELDGISDEKKALYKKQNRSLVENVVVPAYESLADSLIELKSSGNNTAGLSHYPQGKSYYEYLVRSNTGSAKNIRELQKRTERQRNLDIAALHNLLSKNPDLLQAQNPKIATEEPEAILDHLLDAMQADFYPAADSSYEVNYIHESLEDTLAPAFYLTAPIDDISHNVIYLNRSSNYTGIQLFTTLAHEGFPGHLYQTTGSYQAGLAPVRALFSYPGYTEGWATYVEMLSYRYAGLDEDLTEVLMHNQSALLSLYATIDMGVHYDGWLLADAVSFLKGFGITDQSTIKRIYDLIVTEPSHYLKYYIGYLEFLDLKEYAKTRFAEDYSDRAFHQAVIRIGPAPFSILKNYLPHFYSPES